MEIRRRCSVAIVGAGYTAREHIRAFAAVPGVLVAGIHSRTRGRAEAMAAELEVPIVCDSISELYERTRADLVVVTVNELSMPAVSAACFEFPWAVLVEKPPGLSVREAEAIRDRARSTNRNVRVALNRQSYSATQAVLRDLGAASGRRFIQVQDQENPEGARKAGQPERVVANWMVANSIHMLDYFRLMARGDVSRVEALIPWDPSASPCLVVSKIVFSSGDVGLYQAVWDGPGPWAVTATVPRRRWELRPLEQGITQELGQKPAPLELHPWDTEFKPGFRLQAEKMVDEALGKSTDLPTLDAALKTMRLIEAVYPTPWVHG